MELLERNECSESRDEHSLPMLKEFANPDKCRTKGKSVTGLKLRDIQAGLNLSGVEPAQIVSVVATVPQGDGVLQLIYRTPDGTMKERLLLATDEPAISVASAERPFSFEGKGADFQLACEASGLILHFCSTL